MSEDVLNQHGFWIHFPIPLLVSPAESATQDSARGASLMGSCERVDLFSRKLAMDLATNLLVSFQLNEILLA